MSEHKEVIKVALTAKEHKFVKGLWNSLPTKRPNNQVDGKLSFIMNGGYKK